MKKNALTVAKVLIACLLVSSCLSGPPAPEPSPSPAPTPPAAMDLTVDPAAEFGKGEQAFEKGLFQEAFTAYEKAYQASRDQAVREKSFFRMCESLTHLFRYGEAAQLLFNAPLPAPGPERARILFFQAGLGRSFLTQYSYVLSRNESKADQKNVFNLTREEIEKRIDDSFRALWAMKETLRSLPLKDEGYFFRIDGIEPDKFPTLLDFFVREWTEWLLSGRMATERELEAIVAADFTPPADAKGLLETAGIMEQASRFMADAYPASAAYWRVERLASVFQANWANIPYEKADQYRARAATIFSGWVDSFRHPGPRALAGLKAAELENTRGRYVEARLLCERVLKDFSGAPAAKNAAALRRQIVNPVLSLSVDRMTARAQKKLTVNSRNLKQVFFRAHRLNPAVLARLEADPREWYNLSQGYDDNKTKADILRAAPDQAWSFDTGDAGNHAYLNQVTAPPRLAEGVYLIVACHDATFAAGQTIMCSSLVTVGPLMLVGTPGLTLKSRDAYYSLLAAKGGGTVTDAVLRYYAIDGETGKPVDRTNLAVGWTRNYGAFEHTRLSTGKTGSAVLGLPVLLSPQDHNTLNVYPLANKGGAYASLHYPQYVNKRLPNAFEFFIETDRPIYRPGDTLKAKITGVRRTPDGYRALAGEKDVTIRAADPNGNTIMEKKIILNDFGSGAVDFEVPRGTLLGHYALSAQAGRGHTFGNTGSAFQVEEYKRPEFEITFDTPATELRFGQPAAVTGAVKYYFGGAAANADVEYTVTRSYYLPWYFRSWFYGGYSEQAVEKAAGKLKADDAGRFRIAFTPEAADAALPGWLRGGLAPQIAQYTIKVLARDEGGRTIEGTFTCKAGKDGFYFQIEPDKNFFMEKQTAGFALSKLSVNEKPQIGEADYEVFLLENPPLRTWAELSYSFYGSGMLQTGFPGPEFQLKDAKNLRSVLKGKTRFGTDGTSALTIVSPAPGVYRLVLSGKDGANTAVSQEKIFIVVNNQGAAVPISLTSVAAFDKDEYIVGDKARLLLGSSWAAGTYVVEVWAGQYFVRSLLIDNEKPVQVLDIPVTAEMKGGFAVRWFGAKNMELWHGEAAAAVPWNEKKLSVALTPFQNTLRPGEKAAWGVKTVNTAGKPERSEVLLLMYDRSLEYYRKAGGRGFASLYFPNPRPDQASGSDFPPNTATASLRDGPLYQQLYLETRYTSAIEPGFHTDRTAVGYRNKNRMAIRGSDGSGDDGDVLYDLMPDAPMPAPSVSKAEGVMEEKDTFRTETTLSRDGRGNAEGAQAPAVQARQAFADTAFFLPHVTTDKNGAGYFTFTAPEQLTSWKIRAIALTPDASWGELSEEAVTKKDLMVRLDLPRYFREQDKGTVTLIAHNESDKPLSGQVWIEVLDNNQSILAKIKLAHPSKPFSIKPHGLQSFDWAVEIPSGIGAYTVRAVATSDALSDAEERLLPILPSRQRLIESTFAVLKGNGATTMSISPGIDSTRLTESVTLEVDPQLALSLFNTLPFLIDYPYACVEQSLNKYVPLAIINEIYGKYPEVKAAVAKIPKRATVTPAWEKKDPRRALELEETPWGWEAKGRPSYYPVLDLLDPAVVAAQKTSIFNTIKQSQLSSGAFPWWPGGREDLYMTLYVLAGLLEAKRHGVAVDVELVNRALRYVTAVVPQNFKPEPYQLSIIAYASYVVSGFSPKEFPEAAQGQVLVRSWLDFLHQHRFALTPFGKGYLAHVYFRLGDPRMGDEILAMALDGAREDVTAGVYWTPEAYSWVWYSDTVEKHAFFLKTLLEFKPEDKRIDGMARWLLFNRVGNVWKSTKASAAALYALLDYMQKGGALLGDEKFTIDWGKSRQTLVAQGAEWQPEPLRVVKTDDVAGAAALTAAILKEGPGTSFASLTWIYSTDQLPRASGPGLIALDRKFYVRVKEGKNFRLKEISSGAEVAVGDQVEVQVTVNTKSQFEYMHLKDPKATGFEAETLLSGWKHDPLWFYEEPKDSSTNFFFGWIPHGEYVLRYRLRPTKPGEYRVGAATLQSMYAPELNAHSAGFIIKVRK